jgi:glycosyltransferase involved in cell wall biosynthesis
MSYKPKIALIIDVDFWAFSNIAKQIVKNLSHKFYFKILKFELKNPSEASEFKRFSIKKYKDSSKAILSPNTHIGELLIACKDFDLIHFFWRGLLLNVDQTALKEFIKYKNITYTVFKKEFIENKIITTAIYDHLFLDSKNKKLNSRIFNNYISQYYVASKKLFKIYNNIPEYPIPHSVIQDGIDLDYFYPINQSRFNSKRKIIIGWVGNSEWPNTISFARDPKGFKSILMPCLKKINKRDDFSVLFANAHIRFIPHKKMVHYYSKIDLLICVSKAEGTPNPILEAMACGVPVLSTDVGIVDELFGPLQKKFILKDRSIACLYKNLLYILDNPNILSKISNENLKQIQKHKWSIRAKKFDRFFTEALKNKVRYYG